ncbi:MAG: hypothetical protein GX558_11335 [Clostridiales bacterium]|nr:hypothetical protein [Clostridiales bacterium]
MTIYLDGVRFLKLASADFDALPLSVGDEVDGDEYLDRLAAVQSPRAYAEALQMLGRRDMTASALRQALYKKGFAQPAAEAAAARLIENRLIDDARYADRFVELRQDSAAGRYAMLRKLKAKGVDADTAAAAVENLDGEQQIAAALEWVNRLGRRYQSLPTREARAKLSQALARRGFSWDAISSALDRAGEIGSGGEGGWDDE